MTGPRKIGESTGGGALTPAQTSNLNANTSARHTHSNKAILDGIQESFTTAILNNINNKVDIDGAKQLSTEDFTTAEKNKLGNLTDNFKGLFANATARDAAIPAPASGNTVVQDDTNTVWFYDGTVWTDTGNTSTGDMLASLYDPQGISSDAFLRTNHTGAQSITTITGLQTELDSKANALSLGTAAQVDTGVAGGEIPTNDNLSASISGTATFSGDTYTFSPSGTGFRPLQAGMYLSFRLPSGSANTTTTPDIDYDGSIYRQKYTDGSDFAIGDLNPVYNKQPLLWYFDGTDMLLASDISGLNSDGSWCKQSNGYMIQSLSGLMDQSAQTTNAFGTTSGVAYYARAVLDLPKSFSNTSYTGDVSSTGTSISDGTYDNKSTSNVRVTLSSVNNGSTDNPFDAIFTGRWY